MPNRGKTYARRHKIPSLILFSVPFQNNTNFDVGRSENTQNVLNIQPVYPVHLNPSWTLDHPPNRSGRSLAPFFSGRELQALEEIAGPDIGRTEFGLGDLTPEFFFSPRKPTLLAPGLSLVWGVGPAFQLPTATADDELGTGKWSAGPAFVAFFDDRSLHLTTGFLISQPMVLCGRRGPLNCQCHDAAALPQL